MSIIFQRRSIRKYKNKVVPDEAIEKLLRAGFAAPSARNAQPWHFIVINDRNILNEIPKFHPHSKMLSEASHGIIVCGDLSSERVRDFWIQDCSAATQNILLMATELGLGSVWLGLYPNEERVNALKKLLQIPEEVVPLSIIAIGYPDELKDPIDRYDVEKVHYNKW
ncbi:MAG TPA: nitroreductase family protein [Clostridiaceae bacterium]|nr:nitroreductase family protein [Clostridiaceae bacterium]